MRIVYLPNAKQELKEAREWYNKQRKGLGKELMKDVSDLHSRIKNNPFFASIEYQEIRAPSCSRFPYSLHYYIDQQRKQIVILSFFHHKRKPYWL